MGVLAYGKVALQRIGLNGGLMVSKPKRVFISYSWTSEEYQLRVVSLAKKLCRDGVDVVIDVWDLRPGHDKYEFMERSVVDETIDKVLILCDEAYTAKADGRKGGVGDETVVITSEVYGKSSQEKFIPVAMERDGEGRAFLPAYLKSRLYIDLSDNDDGQYVDLLRDIYGMPKFRKPTLGSPPTWVRDGGATTAESDVKTAVVHAKRFAEYSWAELKAIADEIAAAGGAYKGLHVARSYQLVDSGGHLSGDVKEVVLTDGTRAHVRIAGFWHDKRADGEGRAGITFEFADAPVVHRMNPRPDNTGGWDASEMRFWLNGEFRDMLPDELSLRIVEVKKPTNNIGYVGVNDGSVATSTEDAIWLLSMVEVYGELSSQEENIQKLPAVYDAEGAQYKLYVDQGVSTINYSFCKKDGADSWWWLRSPCAYRSYRFHGVLLGGDWYNSYAEVDGGVSPGFCF